LVGRKKKSVWFIKKSLIANRLFGTLPPFFSFVKILTISQ